MTTFTPTRRDVLAALMAATMPPLALSASAPGLTLPVDTPGLDHLDVVVPDVEKTTRFYMGLLRTTLHAQPFQGAQRYFVLLGPLPENRAVGYIAVGASRGRGTSIGHFCTSVVNWQRGSEAEVAVMKERFRKEGFGEFPGVTGFGGLFNSPDGLEIQFLPSPDKLVVEAVPSDFAPSMQGLVTPQGVDHIVAQSSQFDRAVEWYRILYGRESRREKGRATFAFRNGSRLIVEETKYVYGQGRPRFSRFGLKAAPFDRGAVEAGIARLGGKVLGTDGKALRLNDVDGIELELVPA
jgi:hypothetical protein